MAPRPRDPFAFALPAPDGQSADFFRPDGSSQTLHGPHFAALAAGSFRPPPSMATSPGALAQAGDGPPVSMPAPEPPPVSPAGGPPPMPPGPDLEPPAPRQGPPSAAAPTWRDRVNGALGRARERWQGAPAPTVPTPDAGGREGDAWNAQPPAGAGRAGPERFPGLDEGLGSMGAAEQAYRLELADALRGGKGRAAGMVPTTTKTEYAGVASPETVADITAAYGAREAGMGQQGAAAAGGDRAAADAYRQGADDLVAALTRLSEGAERRTAVSEAHAADLDHEGRTSFGGEVSARLQGGLSQLMAINTGRGDPTQGSEAAAQGYYDRALARRKGAYEARTGNIDANARTELAAEPMRGAVTQGRVKGAETAARGEGRAGEVEQAQAQAELERLGLQGKRDAALMGNTEASSKYQAASGGGPDWGRVNRAAAGLSGLGAQQVNAGAVRGAATKPAASPTVVINTPKGSKRMALDPNLPPPVVTETYKAIDDHNALADAQAQLKQAYTRLGAMKFAPGVAGYSEAYQEYMTAVKGVVRIKSQAQRAGTINPGEEPSEIGQFTNPLVAGGAIKSVDETLNRNAVTLANKATGYGGR